MSAVNAADACPRWRDTTSSRAPAPAWTDPLVLAADALTPSRRDPIDLSSHGQSGAPARPRRGRGRPSANSPGGPAGIGAVSHAAPFQAGPAIHPAGRPERRSWGFLARSRPFLRA